MEDINLLFKKTVETAKANGVVDQEGWNGIVDEIVEQYRTTEGQIHDDGPTEGMEEDLRARFGEYEEMIDREGF